MVGAELKVIVPVKSILSLADKPPVISLVNAIVPVEVGKVIVALPFVIELIIGVVNVLPVNVCIAFKLTNWSLVAPDLTEGKDKVIGEDVEACSTATIFVILLEGGKPDDKWYSMLPELFWSITKSFFIVFRQM